MRQEARTCAASVLNSSLHHGWVRKGIIALRDENSDFWIAAPSVTSENLARARNGSSIAGLEAP
jgi:hypothetical protein